MSFGATEPPIAPRERIGVDAAISQLSSDRRLAREAVGKIADMLRTMYYALAPNVTGQRVVACHLRAASVLRSGVTERLNTILCTMNSELERLVNSGSFDS